MVAARVLQPILFGVAILAPALAWAGSAADQTGTGGDAKSTITAPNTTATGVTKPPGVQEGPETPRDRRELDRLKRQNDKIDNSICDGCR